MHVDGIVEQFQENPKQDDLHAVKIIFKYLQGTQDFSLWYPKYAYLAIHDYRDVDWEGNIDDKKITSGGAFYLGPRFISWLRKNKSSISLSNVDA